MAVARAKYLPLSLLGIAALWLCAHRYAEWPLARSRTWSHTTAERRMGASRTPLVSIILPTCNRKAYTILALQQIALQDYPYLEAIVVDDSPGAMSFHDLASSWQNLTVKVVRLNERHSIGAKRNAGAKTALGEVIVHWDVDDLFPPSRISAQVAPIIRGEVPMTMLSFDVFSEMPQGVFVRSDWDKNSRLRPFLGSLAYSRQLFGLLGGFADGSNAEDLHFVDRALRTCNSYQVVTEVRNVYTRHQNNMPGPHNTWQWSSYERWMMLGRRAHRILPPSFLTPAMLESYIAADVDAAQQGNCEVVKSWTSEGLADPLTGENWIKARHFPMVPESCCVQTRGLCPHSPMLPHPIESSAPSSFIDKSAFPYVRESAFPYGLGKLVSEEPNVVGSAFPYALESSSFPQILRFAFPYAMESLAASFPYVEGSRVPEFRTPKQSSTTHDVALPDFLLTLGRETFGTQELLDQVVADSIVVKGTFAGAGMTLRMSSVDTAKDRLFVEGEADRYGLNTLQDTSEKTHPPKIVNMVDIGGNLGVTTIAAFKKYPTSLRAIVVEPVPVTYFFLRWNLWLNGVPTLDEASWKSVAQTPGVLALNRALTDTDDEKVRICYDDTQSMEARSDTTLCTEEFIVLGVSSVSLLNKFGDETISLVKMDCEGCESTALPPFKQLPAKVERLAGELHCPDQTLQHVACQYDAARYLFRVCGTYGDQPIDCQHLGSFANPDPSSAQSRGSQAHGSQSLEIWYGRLEEMLKKNGLVITEGHTEGTGKYATQTNEYDYLAKRAGLGTVCEIGFNAGHSALRFLAQSNATVYEFDLGTHHYSKVSATFLSKAFPGRFHITWGDSRTTVPAFHRTNPSVRCDLLVVDGFHSYSAAMADLENFRMMAAVEHVLIIDDTPCNQEWCHGPTKAWADKISEGCIKQHKVVPLGPDRGYSVGHYTSCSSTIGDALVI